MMGMRIIAIDDNITNLKLLEKLLEEKYNIVCFPDAAEALSYLEKNHADLILSDLMMPEMNGIELLQKLHSKKINIPLVMISAYDKKEYIERAYSNGALKYLVKPINPDELFDVVDNTLTLNP
ncbi:MAG: response regulator [Bacteroidota bacterium]